MPVVHPENGAAGMGEVISHSDLSTRSLVDNIYRLKMNSFSTVRDTQRGSQSYMEKRRGRREIEGIRRRRGRIKRGESKLASNYFLIHAPQSGLLRDVHGVIHKREEGGRRQRCLGG